MNGPEELGRLTELEARAWSELSEGNQEAALESFSAAADNLYGTAMSLNSEGAAPGVVFHWAIEAVTALSVTAAIQAETGDIGSAAHTLGRIGELSTTVDLTEISSLNSGRCEHGRITYDDHKCRRKPCR
ncbi:hypothetical protein ACFV2Q_36355 [Streptomyces sp. NPDC059650]|uniref:hypothetical protein n=1 Tax=Streptomyces sp. NPDC059650 TaxID=3346896 RepID=UPI00368CEA27